MTKVKIFLTFDYELPLGGIARTYKHSLFDPADQLFETANELKVPIVLFADILSAIKFRTRDVEGFYNPFKTQISKALMAGHDVQLHLHPHWLQTELKDGRFEINGKYSLGHYNDIETIVENGYDTLTEICREALPDYKCIAFRAGGYCLQPSTDRILSALYRKGIRYDTSISRGYYFISDESFVDYRNIPDKPNWFLNQNGDLSAESDEGILEIPIASKTKSLFEWPTRFKLKMYKGRAVENRGRQMHTTQHIGLKDKFIQLFSSRMLTVDNHTFSDRYMMEILNHHLSRFRSHDMIMCSLIGHPKSMGEYAHSLLKNFVENVRAAYGNSAEFCTFSQINNESACIK